MSHPAFVPDDPEEWAKANSATPPAAAWQPDDPEEWAKSQGSDQNARLLGKSVNVAPTGEFFNKNMAFHREKREADPLYQSIMEKPAEGQPDHPYARLARATVPGMLNAVDAFKSVIEHFDPKLEKSRYFAQKAMDAMAAGTYSEAGTALQLAKLLKGEGNFRDLLHKGILSGPEVLFGAGPGKDTRTFNAEALQEMGVKSPWIAYPAGFALDLAVNPYNLLKGAGLSKIGKAAEMFTQARSEEQMVGTALPNWEAMAKNGNREARTIVKLLKAGQEDKLNMGVTLAEKVERGQYLFPGVQLPGMKRVNVGKMKWAMDDATWAKVMEDHPGITGKYKPGDVLPKDVMKKLVDAYKDDAFKMVTLHPETKIRHFPIPFPDIHNPVGEVQALPKPLAEGVARLMTKGNRYLREFNPELLKPGVGAIPGAYGRLRKGSSDLMRGLDEAFHKYPQQIIEGKMGDPRIYDGTVRWLRMAMNQKGDLSREAVDALFDLQTQGGDKNAILKLMRHLKVDKMMPDTYRAAETAMSSPMAQEEWARVRSSLEEAPRVVVADRALPDEWELRHFGTNDPAQIQRQANEAIAGAWDDTPQREMVQGISTLEKRLNQHRMDVASLRNAERQASYSGDAKDTARLKEQADELEKSADIWDQTYRKIFGKSMIHVGPAPETPVPPQMPRRPMLPPTQERLRIAQAAAEGLDADLQSVAAEQRALAGSLEAAPPTPGVTNETLARLERANQRAAALQAQMQQRAAEIQRLQDRLAAEGEIDGMVQKVQAGLDKAHETDTAEEIARLEAHPAMKRPAGSLKEVRDERSRLTRDEFEAFKEQKVGDFLKTRYGDDPEDYKAMLEKRAAAYDRSVFKSRAAKSEKAAAKGLRSVAREAEPAAPEPPSLAAPAWRLRAYDTSSIDARIAAAERITERAKLSPKERVEKGISDFGTADREWTPDQAKRFQTVVDRLKAEREKILASGDAAEEIITAPGKTWHDFTLHPPDIQARIEAGEGVETGFVDAAGKFFTREEAAAQGLKMKPPKNPNRPAIGKPRVPLKGSGLPVPSDRPTTSAIERTSFGANNPPTPAAFTANREAGGSTIGLLLTGGQDMHGGLPPIDGGPPGPGGMSMPEYQAWISKTLGESPEIGDNLAKEVADNLVKLSKEGWAKRRAIRDLVDGLIWTEDGRQAIVHAMPEYFPHVSDNVAAYSKPLAYVLGGPPKGGLRTPGFANARKFKDTFDDIQRSYKLVNGKPLLVDDVVTTLMNRVASSIQFQVHNDMLNGMLSSMGLSGKEILAALKAEGIHEIPNARAAANIVNSHYWMRKMGYPEEAIKKVEALNKSLIDLGVWRTGGGPADVQAAEGVADRLAAIVRDGTVPMMKASKEAPETVDLPDGVKNLLKKALGVTEDADLANPANNTEGRLQGTAAAILKKIRRTMKDRDALAPPLKLFITKGELARLADAPDFVNVLSVAKGLRASDMTGDWKTLVNLDPSTIPNFKELDKFGANYFLIPEELANHINGSIRGFLDDSGPRNLFARFYHGATNIWKQSVTTIFPEFHLRNWLTNMYQLQVYAGIDDPAIYWQARKIQLGIPGALLRDDGSVLTHAEVMRLAQKTGVAGHGYFGSDVQELLDPRKGGHVGRLKAAASINPITFGRDMGRFVEENARIAGFAHYLKQGYSPYAASMMVKKFLFDYSELSKFERDFLRGVFPFYAWMRKNIPLQVEQILSKPATMSVSRDIQHAVSGLVNGKDLTPEQFANLPDWLKPMLPILYKNRKDKPKVTAVAGKMSPVSDVMALGQDIGLHGLLGPAVYGVGALNPILKETSEQAFKRDLETGRPLFEVEGRTRPLHLPQPLVGPVGRTFGLPQGKGLVMVPERAGHALQNMRAISFMNSTMKDTEADTTAAQNAETILKNLAGLRSYDVDFEKNYQVEGRKLKKEAQDAAPFKNGRINFDSPVVKEILSRNRKRGEGVPPVSPEERKRFNEWMKKKLDEYRKQRAQRP